MNARGVVVGLLVGLAVAALSGTVTAGSSGWRPLKLDGYAVRWTRPTDPHAPLMLTWRVVDKPETFGDAVNCRRMVSPSHLLTSSKLWESVFRNELQAAFAMWQRAANLVFSEAQHGRQADIVIGAQAEPEGRAFADVAYDRSGSGPIRPITRSLICLNPQVRWKAGFDGNLDIYDLRFTLAHEIGHAIGLDHPAQRGPLMWFRYDERVEGLQTGDIEGAVALYGTTTIAPVPPTTVTGDPTPASPRFGLR